MESYIKGNFRRSIFKSDKGYVIGLFKVRETNDENMEEYLNQTVTFTGYFHELNEDDTYVLYGEVVNHPRYGLQFQTSRYERLKPTGKDAIVTFLSSDLFPGVGEKLAAQIADVLGDNAIDSAKKDLLKFYDNMITKPKFMCIITGNFTSVVKDKETGIYIVPITALKP